MKLSRREIMLGPALCIAAHEARAFQQVGTRDILLKTFREERPPATVKAIPRPSPPKRKLSGPPIVGLTLWRMRPSISSDPIKVRGLVHDSDRPDDNKDWTAERVSMQDALSEKAFVRLSIESASRGYLYLVNRDVYPGGLTSAPILIFPTLRLRGGNNYVEPGVTVEIPEARDRPPVFRIKKTRPDQVSVLLTMVVTPQRLEDTRVPLDAETIPEQRVKDWETKWGSGTERVEDTASVGRPYTVAEQAAAQAQPRPLRPNDPTPVMLLQAKTRPGQPFLVSVNFKLE